jgi:hypothetical protein
MGHGGVSENPIGRKVGDLIGHPNYLLYGSDVPNDSVFWKIICEIQKRKMS